MCGQCALQLSESVLVGRLLVVPKGVTSTKNKNCCKLNTMHRRQLHRRLLVANAFSRPEYLGLRDDSKRNALQLWSGKQQEQEQEQQQQRQQHPQQQCGRTGPS